MHVIFNGHDFKKPQFSLPFTYLKNGKSDKNSKRCSLRATVSIGRQCRSGGKPVTGRSETGDSRIVSIEVASLLGSERGAESDPAARDRGFLSPFAEFLQTSSRFHVARVSDPRVQRRTGRGALDRKKVDSRPSAQ